MKKAKVTIELAMLICSMAFTQTAPTVHQTSTQSTCANIVALSGAKVNCSNLTPAQKKALANIPSILKMALKNQDYLDAIMNKLDEMSKAPTQSSSVVCAAGASCGISTGQQGGITAGTVIGALPPKPLALSSDQAKMVTDAMKPFAMKFNGGGIRIALVGATPTNEKFANDFEAALSAAKIDSVITHTAIMLWAGPEQTPQGLSCSMSPDNQDVAEVLREALRNSKVIDHPIPCKTREDWSGSLTIYITEK